VKFRFRVSKNNMGFEVAHEFIFFQQVNLVDFSLPVLIRNCAPYVILTRRECIMSLSVMYTSFFSFTEHLPLQLYYTSGLRLEFSNVINTLTATVAFNITEGLG
jgi:hypothetical protein